MKKTEIKFLAQIHRNLFPALLGDVLDGLGYRNQFLPQEIRPINDSMIILGRAMPVTEKNVGLIRTKSLADQPFGKMFEALDSLRENEIYIATGKSLNYALWGGLMSIRANRLKAAGVILNGFHRDTREILESKLPVFSKGGYAQDQMGRGKVTNFRSSIQIEKVTVDPGDLIFGDRDGILVIPQKIEKKAVRLALEKAAGENLVGKALKNNMSAADAFKKFGIM